MVLFTILLYFYKNLFKLGSFIGFMSIDDAFEREMMRIANSKAQLSEFQARMSGENNSSSYDQSMIESGFEKKYVFDNSNSFLPCDELNEKMKLDKVNSEIFLGKNVDEAYEDEGFKPVWNKKKILGLDF